MPIKDRAAVFLVFGLIALVLMVVGMATDYWIVVASGALNQGVWRVCAAGICQFYQNTQVSEYINN